MLIAVLDHPKTGDSGHEISHHHDGLPSNVETDHTADKTHHGSGDHHKITGHLVPHKDTAVDKHGRIGSGDHSSLGADRIHGNSGEFIGRTHADRLKNKSKSVHAREDQKWQKDSDKDELEHPDENDEQLKNMAALKDNQRSDVMRDGDRHALPERDMHVNVTAAKHTEDANSSQQKNRRPKRNGRLLEAETQINSIDASAADGDGHTYHKRRPVTDASKKKETRRNSRQSHREDTERLRQPEHSSASQDASGKQSLCQPARSRASPTPCVVSAVGQVCHIYILCQLDSLLLSSNCLSECNIILQNIIFFKSYHAQDLCCELSLFVKCE